MQPPGCSPADLDRAGATLLRSGKTQVLPSPPLRPLPTDPLSRCLRDRRVPAAGCGGRGLARGEQRGPHPRLARAAAGAQPCPSATPRSGSAHPLHPCAPGPQLSTRLGNPYQSRYEVPFCVPGSLGSLKPCACGSALVMGVRMVRAPGPAPPRTAPLTGPRRRSIFPRGCSGRTGCSWRTRRAARACASRWAGPCCSGCCAPSSTAPAGSRCPRRASAAGQRSTRPCSRRRLIRKAAVSRGTPSARVAVPPRPS